MTTDSIAEQGSALPASDIQEIAGRIRQHRMRLGRTLDALASRANLSKSYISRLEDGDRQPSIAALLSISRALGISLGILLSDDASSRTFKVVRGDESPTVPGNGLVYQVHSGDFAGAVMQPLRITISANRTGEDLYRHDGEEWLYVLSGSLVVTIGDEKHTLEPGDSLHFDATVGHRLTADGGKDVEAILVASEAPKNLLKTYI